MPFLRVDKVRIHRGIFVLLAYLFNQILIISLLEIIDIGLLCVLEDPLQLEHIIVGATIVLLR